MAQRNVGLMGQYAGFVTRAVAILIDILIVIISVLVITASISLPLDFFLGVNTQTCLITSSGPSLPRDWDGMREMLCAAVNLTSIAIAVLTGPIYFIFLATAGGQTIGKYVMGVRVVRLDGKPMSYWDGTLRWFGYLASLLPLGLGFFWVVIDDRRRGFHDKIARTCVIYSWRAQQNDRLLIRIQRFFGRVVKRNRVDLMRTLATQPVELVTLAVPGFNELNDVLRIVNSGVENSDFEIIGLQEYAKSADGQINQLEVDPDVGGSLSLVEFSQYGGLTPARIHQIRDELPNDHFALAVLVKEDEADKLVKLVARRTVAQIRRYELRHVSGKTPNPAETVKNSPPVLEESAAAPIATALKSAPPAISPSQPGAPTTAGPATPSPATNDTAGAVLPAAIISELLAGIDELKTEQTTLRIELATKNDALARLETLLHARLSTMPDARAADVAAPAATTSVEPNTARRYAALEQLGAQLAALPSAKAGVVDAALATHVIPQIVATPEDLTAIRGIGPVFEQRLYRAGIGAFWEVATLDDNALRDILALTELQQTQVDLTALRADARRLANERGTVGVLWQGQPPDDFEPIEGIGPVFEQRLYDAGIRTYAALSAATPDQLAQIVNAAKPAQPDYAGWIAQARQLTGQS
jgi:predicted flap endonuclease-1-like 5' DNA nuclease/uncharacterized RDD family membrane protein YckC